jgi:hypothetical protein
MLPFASARRNIAQNRPFNLQHNQPFLLSATRNDNDDKSMGRGDLIQHRAKPGAVVSAYSSIMPLT